MEKLQSLTPEDIRASIADEIAKVESGEDATADDVENEEEESNAEAEQDEAGEESQEEQAEEEGQEEEEEQGVEEKNVPSFRLREERQRRVAAEAKYDRLVAWIEEQTQQGKPKEEKKKIDPVDEEAYEELNGRLDQEAQERLVSRFEDRLEIEQVKAEAKYKDIDQALDYYIGFVAENVMDEHSNISKAQAQDIAKRQISTALFRRFQEGKDIGGDYIYKRATKLGYKPAAEKKSGVNYDAIEKNKAKTEKKQSEKIRVERNESKEDYVKSLVKPGVGLNISEFKKQLAQELKAASS